MASNENEVIHLDRVYRVKEARKLIGNISPSLFWKLVKQGRIKTIKISERVIVVRGSEILKVISGQV